MSNIKLCCIAILALIYTSIQNKLFSQCSSSQSQLTLTIDFTLDNYPDEDAWKLINLTSGLSIDSSCFGDYSNGGIVNETLCVNPNDEYTLLVLDDYGDGLDGAVYQLKYTHGSSIGSVSNTNLAIPYPHCGATYSNNTIVDSINFTAAFFPPPPCAVPSGLIANSWTSNSASLSWIENDTATIWQIEYGTSGFNLGTGNRIISNSNPAIINGLAIATEYEFYVRSICSTGDTSAWAGPLYFKSACNSITNYPYQDNFNDTTTSCWRKAVNTGTTNWELASGTASDISAPYEGSRFMEKDYENSEALLVSPPFDLSSLTTSGQIHLYLHRHPLADPTDQYVVFVSDTPKIESADTLLHIYSKTNITPSVPSKGWYEYFADIPAKYLNQTVYIIIKGSTQKSIFSYDLGIDLFTLREIPSCSSPTLLRSANITNSSADLSWIENGGATLWEIEYGINGFTQGTGIRTLANSNPYTLNGLLENTNYEYYVRAICSSTDSSTWTGPLSFTTKCNSVNSLPFIEDFDGTVNNDGEWDCWKIIDVDGAGTWRQGNQFLNYTRSGQYAALGMGNNNDHLISPKIVLPNKPIVLTLWDKVEHPTFNNIYHILVSTTGDSAHHFTDTLATINAYDTAWTERTIYLSAYANQEIYVSIYQSYSAADYYGFGIDDFKIDTSKACVNPSHISLNSILDQTASFSWIENAASSQWQIQYGTKGFTLGNGKTEIANSPNIVLDSLNSNTSYDFYVRSVCAIEDSSGWTGPYSFTTMCDPVSVPYSQDFENSGKIPNCWRQGVENMENWLFEDTVLGINHVGNLGNFYTTTISGGHFAYVDDSSPHGTTTALLSPLFDLQNTPNPILSFFRISNNEGQRNVEFSVEVWDGSSWNSVFYSDTNSWKNEWEQIIISLDTIAFSADAQVKFTVFENNGLDVADDVAIDDFFIGASNDFIRFNEVDKINTVDANGVADSLNLETFTSGVVANTSYYPYSTKAFTLVDTSSGQQEGIHVFNLANSNYNPNVGDFIMLKGTVGQVNGLQVFYADSIRLVEKNREVYYRTVLALDENTESELVILEDLLVNNIQFNQNWMQISMSNGSKSFVAMVDTFTSVDDQLQLQIGDEICTLKGVGMQDDPSMPYLSNYYISPTGSSDFAIRPKINLGNDTVVCDTSVFELDAGAGFAHYSWNTGDTTQSIPVSIKDSVYIVTVTGINGCSSTDSIKVIVNICTGLNEFDVSKNFIIYPNPTNGIFNMEVKGLPQGKAQISITNMSGKSIKKKTVEINDKKPIRLNVSNEAKGIYFIRLESEERVYHKKLIVH